MGLLNYAMGAFNFLRPYIGKAITWAAPKVFNWLGGVISNKLNGSARGRNILEAGKQVGQWAGTETFQNAMKKFGTTIDRTIAGRNIRFSDGMSAGEAFQRGTNHLIKYVKEGGTIPTGNVIYDSNPQAAVVNETGATPDHVERTWANSSGQTVTRTVPYNTGYGMPY